MNGQVKMQEPSESVQSVNLPTGTVNEKSCVRCGANDRYPGGRCRPCAKNRSAKYHAGHYEQIRARKVKNYEQIREQKAKYRAEKKRFCKKCGLEKTFVENPSENRWICKPCNSKYSHLHYCDHKQLRYEQTAKWRAENPEKVRIAYKNSDIKKLSKPRGRISRSISRRIRKDLQNGSKGRHHWEELVDFTVDQLKQHLEKKFQSGMSWENYGEWHIDHKTPVIAFNFERPEDLDFKKCWSLKNLQPMWAFDNMSKRDRMDKPFQPSLLI